MASEGPNSPSTMANDATVGTVDWADPDKAKINDADYAVHQNIITSPQTSHYLKATNFGFNIPTGATINGIVVEVEKNDPGVGIGVDNAVRIVKANGSLGDENKADASEWEDVDTYFTYGANNDLWSESWTAENINDSDFGFVISADLSGNFVVIRIDHIRITVYYTLGIASLRQLVGVGQGTR